MKQTSPASVIAALILCTTLATRADITLAWNPSPGTVTNYTAYWGTNSGIYVFAASVATQTNIVVTGLSSGVTYYFSVTATGPDGTESPYSNEVIYTNAAAPPDTNIPPIPPGGGGGGTSNISGGGGGGTGGGGSGGSGGTGGTTNGTSSEVSIAGIPPVLTLSFTNHHALLSITGTVGATLEVQSSATFGGMARWNTLTNLAMTNPVASGPTNPAGSTLNLAFVPAAQTYEVIDSAPATGEFYQVMMPYDYMVLADSVLSGQGYPSRLLLVRMPGVVADDLCYVTPQSSFIFYDATNRAFALEPSGSTIRQVATTFSGSLGMNWTSASEFSYSNGVSTILATVVATEPASSDPVAGASAPSIQIDF